MVMIERDGMKSLFEEIRCAKSELIRRGEDEKSGKEMAVMFYTNLTSFFRNHFDYKEAREYRDKNNLEINTFKIAHGKTLIISIPPIDEGDEVVDLEIRDINNDGYEIYNEFLDYTSKFYSDKAIMESKSSRVVNIGDVRVGGPPMPRRPEWSKFLGKTDIGIYDALLKDLSNRTDIKYQSRF
jgi:hypothetical protein